MDDPGIAFASFGLLVLDEIRFPSRKPLTNVLGGSGAYGSFYPQKYKTGFPDNHTCL
jgi:hypothetical protein